MPLLASMSTGDCLDNAKQMRNDSFDLPLSLTPIIDKAIVYISRQVEDCTSQRYRSATHGTESQILTYYDPGEAEATMYASEHSICGATKVFLISHESGLFGRLTCL